MNFSKKYRSSGIRELEGASAQIDHELKGLKGGGQLSDTEMDRASRLIDERNYLDTAISMASPGQAMAFPTGVQGPHADGGQMSNRFDTKGEMFQAMAASVMPAEDYHAVGNFSTGVVDPRLSDMRTRMNYSAAATGANETIPAEGGYLTGTELSNDLLAGAFETGFLGSRVRRRKLTGPNNSIKFNAYDETSRADGSRYGGVQSFWTNEAGALTGSKPTYRQVALELSKLTGLYYATDELVQDAGALEAEIDAAFSSEFGFKIDDAILNGSGAGQPLGILNSGALVTQAAEGGQAADTILTENVIKAYARWLGQRRNGVWVTNRDTYPELFSLTLAVGTGGAPVGLMGTNIANEPFDRLLRMPVLEMEQAATLGDAGDLILFDPSQYVLADKGSIQGAVSIHVRFTNDEIVFRFVYRVDGQPIPSSAITPFKGADTRSPMVTLAART